MEEQQEASAASTSAQADGQDTGSSHVVQFHSDQDSDLFAGNSPYDNLRLDDVMPTVNLPELEPNIILPCRMGIFGPSQCGKSSFIKQLLKYRDVCFSRSFDQIYYCMPESGSRNKQSYLEELRGVCPNIMTFHGIPSFKSEMMADGNEDKLVILDDLSSGLLNEKANVEMMTHDSHHSRISVIYSSQNYYESSKFAKSFQRQLTHKVIFDPATELTVLKNISLQIFGSPNYLQLCMSQVLTAYAADRLHYLLIGEYSKVIKKYVSIASMFASAEHCFGRNFQRLV